jgi:hypothetical protein
MPRSHYREGVGRLTEDHKAALNPRDNFCALDVRKIARW